MPSNSQDIRFMLEIAKIQSRVGGWELTFYIKRMHYFPKISSKGFGLAK